jgi:hypothetical protein
MGVLEKVDFIFCSFEGTYPRPFLGATIPAMHSNFFTSSSSSTIFGTGMEELVCHALSMPK